MSPAHLAAVSYLARYSGSTPHLYMLRTRVDEAARADRRVTGGDVAIWLGVSQRTGRRRLAELLAASPELAGRITPPRASSPRW